ncbi:DUF4160 domain-containing protein [Actimicrobium sp. CCI2.3]|uniref:DUF4160 domain-containing protein n=1 Tax=Actimicrobium sp. CCI2.3 TaxID=3048616 RepID=UPI002AB3CEEF|nr:DUF4160 domain-containing protein [Actimicrobium sp. CCI2.3]MDY7574171.1 DUF4160 domain-containing protein [Actimicrobium sp. CCI2.3]MEB0024026.1 DUF4160 domain-containing protein [Actimicrobium sp. CCI2.3]
MFGLRVVVYPNGHSPAHVHIQGKGCEVVFNLHCLQGPPVLRENYGFSQKELGKIADDLSANLTALCAAWSQYHGDY